MTEVAGEEDEQEVEGENEGKGGTRRGDGERAAKMKRLTIEERQSQVRLARAEVEVAREG